VRLIDFVDILALLLHLMVSVLFKSLAGRRLDGKGEDDMSGSAYSLIYSDSQPMSRYLLMNTKISAWTRPAQAMTMPMQLPSVIGAQQCSSDWLRQEGLKEPRAASLTRQQRPPFVFDLRLSQPLTSVGTLRWELGKLIAYAMAIGSETIGECVVGICAELEEEALRIVLACLKFRVWLRWSPGAAFVRLRWW